MVAPGACAWSRLVRRSAPVTIRAAARAGPWLVIAPHPDDESLGPGSLLAALAAAGGRGFVAFLTDGAGSHPDVPGWSAARVARTRAEEARHALRRLGNTAPPLHLGWRDADPFTRDSADFARSVDALVAWCRRRGIRSIAATWRGEPHCDHEAAADLASAAARRLPVRLYDYLVWGWTLPDVDARLRPVRAIAIDVAAGRARQRRAIACHRSQIGPRIGPGFRLPAMMIALAARPRFVLLARRPAHAS